MQQTDRPTAVHAASWRAVRSLANSSHSSKCSSYRSMESTLNVLPVVSEDRPPTRYRWPCMLTSPAWQRGADRLVSVCQLNSHFTHYIGWQWRSFFIPIYAGCSYGRHDGGQGNVNISPHLDCRSGASIKLFLNLMIQCCLNTQVDNGVISSFQLMRIKSTVLAAMM